MKIFENLTAAMIVEILRKQSHEKIDACKKCRKKCSYSFVFQHLAKLRKFLGFKVLVSEYHIFNLQKTILNAKGAKNYEKKRLSTHAKAFHSGQTC